jgi:hypothetical protein
VVVPGGDEGLIEPLLVAWVSRPHEFSCVLVLDLHAVKSQHHIVRLQVSSDDFGVDPELFGLLPAERFRVGVESGLERVRKNPLDETMVSFQFFVVVVPSIMHPVDVFTIGLRRHFIEVETHIHILRLFFLRELPFLDHHRRTLFGR